MRPIEKLKKKFSVDILGVVVASLCALHCTLLPVALSFFLVTPSFLKEQAHVEEWMHQSLILLSILIAFVSLKKSFYTHKQAIVINLSFIGIAALLASILLPHTVTHLSQSETIFVVIGSLSLAIAHLYNWKLLRQSRIDLNNDSLSRPK